MIYYETPRTVLREWLDFDLAAFAAMNTDPEVMEFFPRLRTIEESQQAIETMQKHFTQYGYGSLLSLTNKITLLAWLDYSPIRINSALVPVSK